MVINNKKFKQFISSKKIKSRVQAIANQINKDYKNKKVLFLCVLDGSFIFAAELYKLIKVKSEISFIKIKSYKGTKSGRVSNVIGITSDIKNKNVIVIEDIVDTGKTISYLRNKIDCKSLKIVTLLSKPETHSIKLDYVGFEISNKFVIGYGLDYNGLGRNLSEIYHET
jgi:hypoxanthine phosphoribosyltransferase